MIDDLAEQNLKDCQLEFGFYLEFIIGNILKDYKNM